MSKTHIDFIDCTPAGRQVVALFEGLCSKGEHGYLVGKGPSLDGLTVRDFPDEQAPIVAINEAIHAVERLRLKNPLICLQQDASLALSCRPKESYWFLSAQAWAKSRGDDYPRAVKFFPKDFGYSARTITAAVGMRLLGLAGIRQITMLAFDAFFSAECGYANSVGSAPGKNPARFIQFAKYLDGVHRQQNGVRLTWVPPHPLWTIVLEDCVAGDGGSKEYLALKESVVSYIKSPYRLLRLGRGPADIVLREEWSNLRFSSLELFRPGLGIGGGILYLNTFCRVNAAATLPDWSTEVEPHNLGMVRAAGADGGISAAFSWLGGSVTAPFRAFQEHPVTVRTGMRWGSAAVVDAIMDSNKVTMDVKVRLELTPPIHITSVVANSDGGALVTHRRDRIYRPEKQAVAKPERRTSHVPEGGATILRDNRNAEYRRVCQIYWMNALRRGKLTGDALEFSSLVRELLSGRRILDVGCGAGFTGERLVAEGEDVYGVDIAPAAVEITNRKLPGRALEGSILSLPYDTGEFAGITVSEVLEYLRIADVAPAIRELWRVSSDRVVVKVSTQASMSGMPTLLIKTPDWWMSCFYVAGFRGVSIRDEECGAAQTVYVLTK